MNRNTKEKKRLIDIYLEILVTDLSSSSALFVEILSQFITQRFSLKEIFKLTVKFYGFSLKDSKGFQLALFLNKGVTLVGKDTFIIN